MRNNEVYGDMTAWIAAHAGDNESDLMRLKRNLRLAREEELTARQRELLRLRYEENMTVTEIAAAIGRDMMLRGSSGSASLVKMSTCTLMFCWCPRSMKSEQNTV